jgi:hypothetical protein
MTSDKKFDQCPLCRHSIRRIHRKFLDRVIHIFKPNMRYKCLNSRCGWEGIKYLELVPVRSVVKKSQRKRFLLNVTVGIILIGIGVGLGTIIGTQKLNNQTINRKNK